MGCQSSLHNLGPSTAPVWMRTGRELAGKPQPLIHARHVLRRSILHALLWLLAYTTGFKNTLQSHPTAFGRVGKPIVLTPVRPFAEIPGLPNNGVLTSVDPSIIRRYKSIFYEAVRLLRDLHF